MLETNRLRIIKYIAILLVLGTSLAQASNSFEMMLETGGVWQNRNDVQIPPNEGTKFDIDQIDKGPFFHYRAELYYRINQHHALRIVYAPSNIKVTGQVNKTIEFNQETFSSNEDLTVKYKFNSYRLSYVYGFWGFGDDQINLGITAKVRDAKITFSQSNVSTSYDNVGFVPLLYFEYQKALGNLWWLNFNVDAAVAKQGRAIDGTIKFKRQINERSIIGIGFRSLEGGADNDKVYTFSWFNYAIAELRIIF